LSWTAIHAPWDSGNLDDDTLREHRALQRSPDAGQNTARFGRHARAEPDSCDDSNVPEKHSAIPFSSFVMQNR